MKSPVRIARPLSLMTFALATMGCGDAISTCEESRSCSNDIGEGGRKGDADEMTSPEDGDGDGDGDGSGDSSGPGGGHGDVDGDGDVSPKPCADGTWDDDDDSETKCVTWSSCEPGEYVKKGGSPTADRQCANCEDGSFSDEDDADECVTLSECPTGIVREGSATSDFECASKAVDVAVGHGYSCILREEGTVACWGNNDLGQLGSGKTMHSAVAVPVVADVDGEVEPLSDVVQLSAGDSFACAIKKDGSVWCWGSNSDGQLGTPSEELSFSSTAMVVPDVAGAAQISTAVYHACVRLEDSTARCWGGTQHQYSELLGGGSAPEKAVVTVLAPEDDGSVLEEIVQISVGQDQSCAVVESGAGYCWGHQGKGSYGELGVGGSNVPIPLLTMSGVAGVAAGNFLTCWLSQEGVLHCKGHAPNGDIFTPDDSHASSPGLARVAVDSTARCVLFDDGTVWCWGDNGSGQLGNDTTENSNTLVQVESLSDIVAIDAGYSHVCAVDGEGHVSCWGNNASGELGNMTVFESGSPIKVPDVTGAVAIESGSNHTCAVLENGRLTCWGSNAAGQLGIGSDEMMSPAAELSGISGVSQFAAYNAQSFAVKKDGTVRGWGGGLGRDYDAPNTLLDLSDAVNLAVGGGHACAVIDDGTLQCWGDNDRGQAGIDSAEQDLTQPTTVPDIQGVESISAGAEHTCLVSDGEVWCFGFGYYGQTGQFVGGVGYHFDPRAVAGLSDVSSVSLGSSFSLALRGNGQVVSWGLNQTGQLGDGMDIPLGAEGRESADLVVGVSDAVGIAAGTEHACAALSDGSAVCWGKNDAGQLGLGDLGAATGLAQPVMGLKDVVALSAGSSHSCALHSDGSVSCWGSNELYQLGRARSDKSIVPVEVSWQ